MSDATIALETVLAAIIEGVGGVLTVPAELLKQDRAGMSIAIEYDDKKDRVMFTLVESEDIEYDDDNNV